MIRIKTAEELYNELCSTEIDCFLSANTSEFVSKDIAIVLDDLLKSRGLIKADVIECSRLDKIYAYQIFQGIRTPSRDKFLPLCFAMHLSFEETQDILRQIEMPVLYIKNRRDSIIIYALERQKNVLECNELLYEAGESILD